MYAYSDAHKGAGCLLVDQLENKSSLNLPVPFFVVAEGVVGRATDEEVTPDPAAAGSTGAVDDAPDAAGADAGSAIAEAVSGWTVALAAAAFKAAAASDADAAAAAVETSSAAASFAAAAASAASVADFTFSASWVLNKPSEAVASLILSSLHLT